MEQTPSSGCEVSAGSRKAEEATADAGACADGRKAKAACDEPAALSSTQNHDLRSVLVDIWRLRAVLCQAGSKSRARGFSQERQAPHMSQPGPRESCIA